MKNFNCLGIKHQIGYFQYDIDIVKIMISEKSE